MIKKEHEFIEALKLGEEQAFRELVLQYQDKVFNTCLGFVKDHDNADDLAQEVFVEVFRSIHSFRGDAGLSTWIYRIAVNKSLEYLRKMKRRRTWQRLKNMVVRDEKQQYEVPDFNHPGVLAENDERAKILFQAIDKLPENQRVAFMLHKLEGVSYDEIAEIMEKSKSSVESLMHRANNNLRKLLYHYYNED